MVVGNSGGGKPNPPNIVLGIAQWVAFALVATAWLLWAWGLFWLSLIFGFGGTTKEEVAAIIVTFSIDPVAIAVWLIGLRRGTLTPLAATFVLMVFVLNIWGFLTL